MPTTQGLRTVNLALCAAGCVDNNTLSRNELQNQRRVNAIVFGTLCDYELGAGGNL